VLYCDLRRSDDILMHLATLVTAQGTCAAAAIVSHGERGDKGPSLKHRPISFNHSDLCSAMYDHRQERAFALVRSCGVHFSQEIRLGSMIFFGYFYSIQVYYSEIFKKRPARISAEEISH
jgi:hypothetical protein